MSKRNNELAIFKMLSDGSDIASPPQTDELEISIFGPGYGESIVIHIGNGEWIIVDSCAWPDDEHPAALAYLNSLGVDPSSAVTNVIATHWHDDHIRGLGKLFESTASAHFWTTMALQSEEWLNLVQINRHNYLKCGSGVREMERVMNELQRRAKVKAAYSPKFAIEGRAILERSGDLPAKVTAYAPSDAAVSATHKGFLKLLDDAKRRQGRLPSIGANEASVVLSVQMGLANVLLGGDLEESGRDGLGWTAVLQYAGSSKPPHCGLKIPHHGSSTGHHPEVWPQLMADGAWAVVTPWGMGGQFLPGPGDAQRILEQSANNAYLTAPPRRSRYKHYDPTVERTFREMKVKLFKDNGRQGHVRMRRNAVQEAPWRVELFGEACALSEAEL